MLVKGKPWASADELDRAFNAAWQSLAAIDRVGTARPQTDDLARLWQASADLCDILRKKYVADALARAAVRLRLPSVHAAGLEAVHAHLLVAMLGQLLNAENWPALAGMIDTQNLAVRLQQEKLSAREEAEVAREKLAAMRQPPSENTAQEWSEARSPSEWAKRLGVSVKTLNRHEANGFLHIHRETSKSWRILKSDLG